MQLQWYKVTVGQECCTDRGISSKLDILCILKHSVWIQWSCTCPIANTPSYYVTIEQPTHASTRGNSCNTHAHATDTMRCVVLHIVCALCTHMHYTITTQLMLISHTCIKRHSSTCFQKMTVFFFRLLALSSFHLGQCI